MKSALKLLTSTVLLAGLSGCNKTYFPERVYLIYDRNSSGPHNRYCVGHVPKENNWDPGYYQVPDLIKCDLSLEEAKALRDAIAHNLSTE